MTNSLKPCPFCGSEAKLFSYTIGRDEIYHVECKRCNNQTREYAYKWTAIKHWNRRLKEEE